MKLSILKKEARPDGTTVVTVDLDGVRTIQLVTKTEVADTLSLGDLRSIHNLIASTTRPPTGKPKKEES